MGEGCFEICLAVVDVILSHRRRNMVRDRRRMKEASGGAKTAHVEEESRGLRERTQQNKEPDKLGNRNRKKSV